MQFWWVVPAAGAGQRMGAALPKQYLSLAGRSVFYWTLKQLSEMHGFAGTVVAIAPDDQRARQNVPEGMHVYWAEGGVERSDSVARALEVVAELAAPDDWVLVHDVARPCIDSQDVERLIEVAVQRSGGAGALLAAPIADTIKRAQEGAVAATVDRSELWSALTPQMFRLNRLREALRVARQRGVMIRDESSAVELLGDCPLLVRGRRDNLKITWPEDMVMVEAILSQRGVIQ